MLALENTIHHTSHLRGYKNCIIEFNGLEELERLEGLDCYSARQSE